VHNPVDKLMQFLVEKNLKIFSWPSLLAMIAFLLSQAAAAPASAPVDATLWGEAVDGTSVGIAIEPAGRNEWHPGEIVRIIQSFRARKNARVPAFGLVTRTTIHLLTPEGKEVVWSPMKLRERREAATQRAQSWVPWKAEGPYPLELRLSEGAEVWTDAKTGQAMDVSLRKPGTYKVFAVCEVDAGPTAPKGTWRGRAHSGVVNLVVNELPPGKRSGEMTAGQKQLVDAWVAGKEVGEELRREVILSENEGLARRLVELLKTQKPKRATLTYKIISQRVGTQQDGDAGIDGPYLKDLAAWVVDVNEGKVSGRERLSLLGAVQHAIVYLEFHPEDTAMRQRVVTLLTEWCHLPRTQGAAEANPAQTGAWRGLMTLGELKEGMTTQRVIELLGKPDEESADLLAWVVTNPQLANPVLGKLEAAIKEGKVTTWRGTGW
jgi:hypothetical protein